MNQCRWRMEDGGWRMEDGAEGSGERMKTKGRSQRIDGCADDVIQVEAWHDLMAQWGLFIGAKSYFDVFIHFNFNVCCINWVRCWSDDFGGIGWQLMAEIRYLFVTLPLIMSATQ